jgi:hypothetical protein
MLRIGLADFALGLVTASLFAWGLWGVGCGIQNRLPHPPTELPQQGQILLLGPCRPNIFLSEKTRFVQHCAAAAITV